jgi:hypothetical protein
MNKSLGSAQKTIVDAVSLRPMSKNQILDDTGLGNATVTNALKSLSERGFIVKDGAHYKAIKKA